MKKLREGFMEVAGSVPHRVYWAEHGDPQGAPVLLIPPTSGYLYDMEKMTGFENTPLRLIELHPRGMGRSLPAGEARENTVDASIGDIEELRKHLDIEKWSIFAWSFGAVAMAGYVQQNAARCERLIAYAPYLGSEEDYGALRQKSPEIADAHFRYHQAQSGRDMVKSHFNKAAAPDFATRFKSYCESQSLWGDTARPDEIYARKSRAEWENLFQSRAIGAAMDLELFTDKDRFLEAEALKPGYAAPRDVTLIYGGDDHWSAPNSYARTVFPSARVLTVDGAGHDVHDTRVQAAIGGLLTSRP